LRLSRETFERHYRLKAKGVDLKTIAQRVSKLLNMPLEKVWAKGKYRRVVAARSLICYWAVTELDMSASALAGHFRVSATAISKSVLRGKTLAVKNDFAFEDNEV